MAQITFEKELEILLNKHSKENGSNTPDFLLVDYLMGCLSVYNKTLKERDGWFGIDVWEDGILKQNIK
jgi:hypothetical protein